MGLFFSRYDDELVANLAAHQADVLAYVGSLMPGDSSVADVVQRTNIVVWNKRSSFKRGTNFRAWMFAIARLEVRAYRKECKRKSWLVVDDELVQRITETMVASAEACPMDDLRIALEICMKKLKPAERELVDHRYYSDELLQGYAESQRRSVGAIKVSLFRIRAVLKRCIESELSTEPATPS